MRASPVTCITEGLDGVLLLNLDIKESDMAKKMRKKASEKVREGDA